MAQRRAERLHAGRVPAAELAPVQVLPVEEERLAEILRRAQVGPAGADTVPVLGRLVRLADQSGREIRPCSEPAVPVAGRDLFGDGQAFPDIGHPRIGLCDTALQLAVTGEVVEIQLHRYLLEVVATGGAARCSALCRACCQPWIAPSKVLGSDRRCGPCRSAEEGRGACRTSATVGSRVASARSWRPWVVGVPQAALKDRSETAADVTDRDPVRDAGRETTGQARWRLHGFGSRGTY
jgi:hypothetical protein